MSSVRMADIRKFLLQNEGGAVIYYKEYDSGVAILELSTPNPTNMLTGRMMVELRDAIEIFSKWQQGKAIIIFSTGDNFCKGVDQTLAQSNQTPPAAQDMSYWMSDTLFRLRKLPFLTVCLLTGVTEGFGAEIPLYCDYVLMSEEATISFNHCKMGITPGWGGGVRLWERVGKKKAMDILLTAKIVTAKEAVNMGIADDVVSSETPMLNAMSFIDQKIQSKAVVVQAIKKMHCCKDIPIAAYESVFERNTFSLLWSGPTYEKFLANSYLTQPSTSAEEESKEEVEDQK